MSDWATWAQMAGVGGLVLGLYNAGHGLREPVRLHQRELRKQLRDWIYDINKILRDADGRVLGYEAPAPPQCPEAITEAGEELGKFNSNLRSPGDDIVTAYQGVLRGVEIGWSSVGQTPGEGSHRRTELWTTKFGTQKYTTYPSHSDYLGTLRSAIRTGEDITAIINRIDNGSYLAYLRYRSSPKPWRSLSRRIRRRRKSPGPTSNP